MIASMTAFARKACHEPWGSLVVELRCVNHRYLELAFRLPEMLRSFEPFARERIQSVIRRGKVDVCLKYQPGPQAPVVFSINENLLRQLAVSNERVQAHFGAAHVNALDVLAWPGVVDMHEADTDALMSAALMLLDEALIEQEQTRAREGASIGDFLCARLADVRAQLATVAACMPEVMREQQEKTERKMAELLTTVDEARLMQEMAWLLQKSDIAEELQRLEAHLDEVARVIARGGAMGRRLDFLMQELNREANTLSSKSHSILLTQAAVDMKVLIEQMREQVQNIE